MVWWMELAACSPKPKTETKESPAGTPPVTRVSTLSGDFRNSWCRSQRCSSGWPPPWEKEANTRLVRSWVAGRRSQPVPRVFGERLVGRHFARSPRPFETMDVADKPAARELANLMTRLCNRTWSNSQGRGDDNPAEPSTMFFRSP